MSLPISATDYLSGRTPELTLSFPELCQRMAAVGEAESAEAVRRNLDLCGEAGVYRWFLPTQFGGWAWTDPEILRGYLQLSAACLTTTFVITQRVAATKRLVACGNATLRGQILPRLSSADTMISVGISHLTTSGQHLQAPLLVAKPSAEGFVLQGLSPWVTGGPWCDYLVLGATLPDQQQVLVVVSTDWPGVTIETPLNMMALTASRTGVVRLDSVFVPWEWVMAGPQPHVLQAISVGTTGGLQTSALALGLAAAAIQYLEQQATARDAVANPARELREQWQQLRERLLAAAADPAYDANSLRASANDLVLRATQAALLVAKGTGFVAGHAVGRWCREALFFLVWSCPQWVQDTHLCEFSFNHSPRTKEANP
jgi:alkylation response protein AidB-like acyl-CoA dehydrogenase